MTSSEDKNTIDLIRVKFSNHKNMVKTSIAMGVIGFLIVVVAVIYIQNRHLNSSVDLTMTIMGLVIIIGPIFLYLILNFFLTKKVTISVSNEKIIINKIMTIPFKDIVKLNHVVNSNAFHSLTIIHLRNGQKYSIAPINKFHRYSLGQFHKLAYKAQKIYNLHND